MPGFEPADLLQTARIVFAVAFIEAWAFRSPHYYQPPPAHRHRPLEEWLEGSLPSIDAKTDIIPGVHIPGVCYDRAFPKISEELAVIRPRRQ